MKTHNVLQGSPEWNGLRANHFTASEAPAMMGASKYQSRNDLLAQKKTGLTAEVSPAQQALFDRGHATEALARPIVEDMIGEELFPIVCTEGKLLASLDGATMLVDTLFEHKLWNEGLAAQVRAGELEPHYYWQLEQQLLVSGAERVIFVCSDGTRDNFVSMEYRAVPGRAGKLAAGWAQFDQDLADYVPQAAAVERIGRAPGELPALRIEVTGMVTASNLDAFTAAALAVFDGINTDLQSDQDFADAERTVKWCSDVEERLAAAKQHALSQTDSIDALFRAIDEISAEARTKRLELDKLVKGRKQAIRDEIVLAAQKSLTEHIERINSGLGRLRLPPVGADFAGAIKGKKTVASLRDAADTELARAKIEASQHGERMQAGLAILRELAAGFEFLFSDAAELVMKDAESLSALIRMRITDHQAAEQAKAAERAEAERVAAEATPQPEPVQAAPVEVVEPIKLPEPTADHGERIKLGEIGARLGFNLSGDFLETLGFSPVSRERGALLYQAGDFPRICQALVAHINGAMQQHKAAA